MYARVVTLLLLTAVVAATSHAQDPCASAVDRRIRVGVVLAPGSAASRSGVILGLEEAQHTGRMFGWELELVRPPDSLEAASAVEFLTAAGVTAIVADLEDEPVSGHGDRPLILSVARRATRRRAESAPGHFFMLPAIDSARARGGLQTQSAPGGTVMAWHPTLERFGAGEINQRFRVRFAAGMDERAWAGWMAMKILIEAVLRTQSADPRALERFLSGPTARFDGHKGVPLHFDIATRDLVQPVFLVRDGAEPVILPARTP